MNALVMGLWLTLAQQAPLDVPYEERSQAVLPEKEAWPQYGASRAWQIPLLTDVTLPAGVREIRISDNWPAFFPLWTPVLRVVDFGGGQANGELLWVYRSVGALPNAACATVTEPATLVVCARPGAFQVAPDWLVVTQTLEDLGAWSVSKNCLTYQTPDGRTISRGALADGGDLEIYRLVGDEYGSYSCPALQLQTESDSGRAANSIYEYFHDFVRTAIPPPPIRDVLMNGQN